MYHLHVKFINKKSSRTTAGVLEYIARLGPYRNRGDTVRELIVTGMPDWVTRPDGLDFWQCADSTKNRVNALLAFTIQFAIPRVVTLAHQRELVMLMINAVSSVSGGDPTKHGPMPNCAAIHEGYGRNPHVHLMMSTSIPDGLQRSAKLWFKRHNSKAPATGGARRSRAMGTKSWLRSIRETWAKVVNHFLQTHGYSLRIDHRSNKARGLPGAPGIHLGPSAAYLMRNDRPAPRAMRHAAREAERRLQEKIDAEIATLSKTQKELAAERARDEQHYAQVERQSMAEIDECIDTHPFAASNKEILSSMSWMVTDESTQKSGQLNDLSLALLAQEAGDSWLMRQHKAGIFFAHPALDGLVMISRGFVTSDSEAKEALELGLRLSKALNFVSPMVAAKEAVMDTCRTVLEQLHLPWPLRHHAPKSMKVNIGRQSTRPRA